MACNFFIIAIYMIRNFGDFQVDLNQNLEVEGE